jgi:hypothetical protein
VDAARFCSVIEQTDHVSRGKWLAEVEAALSAVYASAVQLPSLGSLIVDQPVGRMSTDEWSELYAALRLKTGTDDTYWHVFDPGERTAVVQGSLADDLAEIYRSLGAGLEALRSGAAPEDVIFGWRSGFDLHWATHAVGAMSALRGAQKKL